jgi:LysM repeat protein
VALAWGILLILTAAGPIGSFRPAPANTRIASSTSNITSNTTQVTLTRALTTTSASASTGTPVAIPTVRPAATAASATVARPAARPGARTAAAAEARTATRPAPRIRDYVVRPGDTLSGIAAALGIPGGWPALYAANRRTVGPNPGLIRSGAVLALPGRAGSAGYTVAVGDTLSGIAIALGIPGRWPALYAANRRAIGPDPNAIRAGIVLAMPPTAPAPSTSPAPHAGLPVTPAPRSGQPSSPAPHAVTTPTRVSASARSSASAQPPAAVSGRASGPASAQAPTSTNGHRHPRSIPALPTGGLPRWLEIVLVGAGLLIATAFLTEPALAIARRRRAARPAAAEAHIVLADYERLVVTHSRQDGTVYVLRPPDADPHAILLAARLVLAQDRYEALAGHLGVPAHWPRE